MRLLLRFKGGFYDLATPEPFSNELKRFWDRAPELVRLDLEVRLERLAEYGEIVDADTCYQLTPRIACIRVENHHVAYYLDGDIIVLLHAFTSGLTESESTEARNRAKLRLEQYLATRG